MAAPATSALAPPQLTTPTRARALLRLRFSLRVRRRVYLHASSSPCASYRGRDRFMLRRRHARAPMKGHSWRLPRDATAASWWAPFGRLPACRGSTIGPFPRTGVLPALRHGCCQIRRCAGTGPDTADLSSDLPAAPGCFRVVLPRAVPCAATRLTTRPKRYGPPQKQIRA